MPIRRKQGARSTSPPRAPPRSWCSPRQGLPRPCCSDPSTVAWLPLLASGSAFARLRPDPRDLLRQHLHGLADLLLGVRCRAEEAQARRGLLDRRIEDRLHVDAALLEPVAHLQGVQRIPQDGGDHRAPLREAGVDALLLGQPQEAKLLLRVPIQRATSARLTPKCSPRPAPVFPITPMECASSTSRRQPYFFFSSTNRGSSGESPSIEYTPSTAISTRR